MVEPAEGGDRSEILLNFAKKLVDVFSRDVKSTRDRSDPGMRTVCVAELASGGGHSEDLTDHADIATAPDSGENIACEASLRNSRKNCTHEIRLLRCNSVRNISTLFACLIDVNTQAFLLQ